MMTDSDFWRDIAIQFRAIPCGTLRADWVDGHSSVMIMRTWHLRSGSITAHVEFEALATRAGAKIAAVDDKRDSLTVWLDTLKENTPESGITGYGQIGPSDSVHMVGGMIQDICVASADLCKRLESKAVEEERRNPPPDQRPHSLISHPSAVIRGHQMMLDAEHRARADVHYEKTLQKLRQLEVDQSQPAPIIPTAATPQETNPAGRKSEVDAFLEKANQLSPTKLLRRHIWLLAGHSKGRQFEYWQASDSRATGADDRNFKRILVLGPSSFITELKQKRIIPTENP